jgi:hypothetical protein
MSSILYWAASGGLIRFFGWEGTAFPATDTKGANGRDHNPHGFTVWLAGG